MLARGLRGRRVFTTRTRSDARSTTRSRAGRCDEVCAHCGALHWKAEQPSSGNYKTCCNGGKLKLPDLPELPPYLKSLLDGSDKDSKKFLNDARYYGNAMASARPRPLAPTICISRARRRRSVARRFGSQVVEDRTYSKDHGGVAALRDAARN